MIKKILFFLLSILLTSFLVGAQTTIVNLMWLSSVEMPVTLMVLISSLFQDFYMLSLSPVVGMLPVSIPPLLPTLILLGFLISFSFTWLALKWVKIEKKYAYGHCRGYSIILYSIFDARCILRCRYVSRSQDAIRKS